MKKYIFLAILLFTLGMKISYAYENAPNECLDDNSCMLVCNYVNKFDVTRIISIYYHFDDKWSVSYWNGIADIGESGYYGDTKGPKKFADIFSKNGSPNIYWELDNIDASNFKCPEHAYFDRNAVAELCFSNESELCEKKSDWISTKFGQEDSAFEYDEKDYDFEDQILHYKDWIFGDIKEQISNGEFDVETELYDKIKKDFQTNYLYGNIVPTFIANSDAYQSVYESIGEEFEKAKQEEVAKADQDLETGKTTQEEHDQVVNNWNNVDTEKVEEQGQQALEDIKRDSIKNSLEWEANSCDSILGNVNDKNDPAYYLDFAFKILKYAAIIVLFVLTVLDFAKSMVSNDNDALKKSLKKAVKRIIICVIIFFLPILINFILNLLGVVDDPTCGIGVN